MNDDIIRMAQEAGFLPNANPVMPQLLARFADLVRADERERIKAANAPEIERINAHIKALEEAVADEREACARICEQREFARNAAISIRARSKA